MQVVGWALRSCENEEVGLEAASGELTPAGINRTFQEWVPEQDDKLLTAKRKATAISPRNAFGQT